MKLIHILNNYHDPFPHIDGKGGLFFHSSRHMTGGMLQPEGQITERSPSVKDQLVNTIFDVLSHQSPQPIQTTDEDIELLKAIEAIPTKIEEPKQAEEPKKPKKKDEKDAQEKLNQLSEELKIISKGKTKLGEIQSICKKHNIEIKKTRSSDGKIIDKTKDDLINDFKEYIKSMLKPQTPISEQDQEFHDAFQEELIKIQKLIKEIQSSVGIPVLSKSVNDYLDKVLHDIKQVEKTAKSKLENGEYPKTKRIMESIKSVIEKIKTMKHEITDEEKIEIYKKNDEEKYDTLSEKLYTPLLSIIQKVENSEELSKYELDFLRLSKKTIDSNELTPEFYPKTTAFINLVKNNIDDIYKQLEKTTESKTNKIVSVVDEAEQRKLAKVKKRAEIEANLLKAKNIEKPESISLPEPEIEKEKEEQDKLVLSQKINDEIENVCRSRGLLFKDPKDLNEMITKGVVNDRKTDDQISNYVRRELDTMIFDKKIEFYTERETNITTTDYKQIKLIDKWINFYTLQHHSGLGKAFEAYFENKKRMKLLQGPDFGNDKSSIENNDKNKMIPLNYPDGRPIIRTMYDGTQKTLREVCIADLYNGSNLYELKQRNLDFIKGSTTIKAVDMSDTSIPFVPFEKTKFGNNDDYEIYYTFKNGKWCVYNIMMKAKDIGDNGIGNFIFEKDYKNYHAVFLTVDGIYIYDICNDITDDDKDFSVSDKRDVKSSKKRILVRPNILGYNKKTNEEIYDLDSEGNKLYKYYTTSYSTIGKKFNVDKSKFKKL